MTDDEIATVRVLACAVGLFVTGIATGILISLGLF